MSESTVTTAAAAAGMTLTQVGAAASLVNAGAAPTDPIVQAIANLELRLASIESAGGVALPMLSMFVPSAKPIVAMLPEIEQAVTMLLEFAKSIAPVIEQITAQAKTAG